MKSKKAPVFDAQNAIGQAQQQNTSNAFQQAAFNRPNQSDQFGNTLQYSQTGTDAQGNPIFGVSQGMGALGQQYAGGLAGLGQQYFQGANNFLNNPADLSSGGAFDRAYSYATANLEPRFEKAQAAMENRLANQGLNRSSEAWKSAMNDLALQQNEARNSLVSGLQGQMFQQALQGREQGLGELMRLTAPGMQFGNAAMGGNYVTPAGVNVQNTDVAGLLRDQYNSQMARYQADQQNRMGMLGGLASLGGSILAAPMTGGTSLGGALGSKIFGL